MKIKTVSTVLTTNSAGQVVESLPVREVAGPLQNTAGQWVDAVAAVEALDGVPVRFVPGAVTLNSVGQPVDVLPIRGAPSWLTSIDPAALGGVDFANDRSYGMSRDFARASTGFARNAAGVWVPFGSGELRRTDRGALIEPSRANLCTNNTGNSSGGGLNLVGATVAALPAGDSPANDNNGKRVTQGAGGTDAYQQINIPVTAGGAYSFSCSFKFDASTTWVRLVFSDNVAHGLNLWLNLASGALGTVGPFGSASVTGSSVVSEGNGWYRAIVSGTLPNTVAACTLATVSVTGNGVNTRAAGTYGIWGIQAEAAAAASSPILTSGSAVTRAADDLDLRDFVGTKLRFTFDNDTTQEVAGVTGPYQVPTTLNRSQIKSVISLAA